MHSMITGIQEEERVDKVNIVSLGDRALLMDWGGGIDQQTHEHIRAFCVRMERECVSGVIETIPSFTTVTIVYEPMELRNPLTGERCYRKDGPIICSPFERLKGIIEGILHSQEPGSVTTAANIVHIPVCYGGEFGPDLQEVAEYTGLSTQEVIALHGSQSYVVYMVGFAPGFPYLGGMSERLAVPRRSSPRASIAPGSVGIGGSQTGVYPLATPGGWQLIGRTPRKLFRPHDDEPSLLKMGDIVRFYPIEPEQYVEWKEDEQ